MKIKISGLLVAVMILSGAGMSLADATWLETNDGVGRYDYIEKDSTAYVHYGTDWGSWNYSAVWVIIGATGHDYPGVWQHDDGGNKHLSTGNLSSGNHGADWVAGKAVDLYPKVDDDGGGGSPTQSTYLDELMILDIQKTQKRH